ncbi:MAG: triose-phosphate isomerase [Proteobacteria bacterium]|nr:triose-phosphate isomerase [Pseudomonadota bacterium]
MRSKIIAGNWKMHGSKDSVTALLSNIKSNFAASSPQLIVFPPYVYLEQVQQTLKDTKIQWGAQNLSANEPGAYTGEVAAQMLLDFGCKYSLVGHSERRSFYHEDNILVAMKFAQAQRHHLIPILCVGETLQQREQGLTEEVIREQLQAVLLLQAGVQGFRQAVIAYEPVWAIGTGLTATPEQAQEVHQFIRRELAKQDEVIAAQVSIIYGGSVKAVNAKSLFAMPDIDGGLVGGASLDAHEFVEIAKCIN